MKVDEILSHRKGFNILFSTIDKAHTLIRDRTKD